MNKLFTKIATVIAGFAMVVGVGVATANNSKEAKPIYATINSGYTAATMTGGTNGSAATVVVNEQDIDAIKVGSSSKGGDMLITIPSGHTDLRIYAAAWKGVEGLSLTIAKDSGATNATITPSSIALTADDGMTNNSPFTLSGNESSFMFDFTLANVTQDTVFKFASSLSKRFVVWSAQTKAATADPVKLGTPAPSYNDLTKEVTWANVDYAGSYSVKVDSGDYFAATSPLDVSNLTVDVPHTVYVKAISNSNNYLDSDAGSVEFTPTAPKVLDHISVSNPKIAFNQLEEWSFDGTVTAHYEDESTIDVTSLATFSGYNTSNSGNQTVTVSYTEGAITKTTTYGITVSQIPSVSFVAGTDNGNSSSQSHDTISKTGITIDFSSARTVDAPYRIYSGSTTTISSTIGNILKIVFEMNGDYNSNLFSLKTGETGTFDNSNSKKGIWTGSSSSVAFKASAQARCDSITIYLVKTASDLVSELHTSTSLAYHYVSDANDDYTYSNICIRFGGKVSKDLWNELDTNQHKITGFGVMIADSGIVATHSEFVDIINDESFTSSTVSTDITNNYAIDYFVPVANLGTVMGEEGDYYFWNLRQTVDQNDMYSSVFSAIAYIKVEDEYVLMNMAKESVKTLAEDYLNNRGYNQSSAADSLQYIVDNAPQA